MDDRRKHFAVDRLSAEGQAIVRRGFDDGWTLDQIADELAAKTGEIVSLSALHRWNSWEQTKARFAEREKALDTAVELIKIVPDGRFIRNLNNALKSHLLAKEPELEEQSLPELLEHMLSMERMELQHARLKVAQQVAQAETIKAVAAEKSAEASMTQADASLMNAQARIRQLEEQARKAAAELAKAEQGAKDGRVPIEVLKRVKEDLYGLGAYEGGHAA